jgi:hypothetical protein
VQGVPRRALWEYCRTLAQTGCGFYPRSVFVHVDVRAQAATWVDWSMPGARPRYGTLDRPYRRRELKRPDRPRIGRKVTRPDEVPLVVEVVNRQNTVVRTVDEHVGTEQAAGEAPLEHAATDAADAADAPSGM